MNPAKTNFIPLFSILLFTGCGGGGGDNSASDSTPITDTNPSVGLTTLEAAAYEKSNDFAKFIVNRSGTSGALSLTYTLTGSTDITRGSASAEDYQLVYSDGGDVGTYIELGANQNSRVIEVRPIDDSLFETRETLGITLETGSGYVLSSDTYAEITISDATNTQDNAKVFIGIFGPQDDAVTTAGGSLSLVLQGDNDGALITYSFYGLTSPQTDQHIHLFPSGTVIKDIEQSGPVTNYSWDLAPGGIFTTRQQLLDALFNGELYLNIHTSNYPIGEISASFIYQADVAPPENIELTEEQVDRDILRFLTQATFGPTPESYEDLRSQIDTDGSNRIEVYNNWIEQQFTTPQTSMLDATDEMVAYFASENGFRERRDTFWPMAVYGKDQLRQRMIFALSEILVIGDQSNPIRSAHRGAAHYWDTLGNNAFGTYRNALEDVTRHPIMGSWLSHLRNQKEDTNAGTYPDENYAREIMQLFSFGLVQLQNNGAIKLDQNNLPIATYDNTVISQMARVFTGLSFSSRADVDGNAVENNQFALNNATNPYQHRWTQPMKFFPNEHEFGEKILFTDQGSTLTIPASSDLTESAADTELGIVLDAIVSHSSTAPFISRQLIQRLVTSNPSANYIDRVATAFGDTGDMQAVIKAILLDQEARNPSVIDSQTFGKAKEPVVLLSALMRLLEAGSQVPFGDGDGGVNFNVADSYDSGATLMRTGDINIGQYPLGASSVFNFFSPDYSPTGALASNGLVAPELQLLTEAQLFTNLNKVNALLNTGTVRRNVDTNVPQTLAELVVTLKMDRLEAVWNSTAGGDSEKATALVDYLDNYLNAGQLQAMESSDTRDALITAVIASSADVRARVAVYGAMSVPEFQIQR
jgi:uncharacterized protein (DUF1800 family)